MDIREIGVRLQAKNENTFDVIYDAHDKTRIRELHFTADGVMEGGGGDIQSPEKDGIPFYSYALHLPAAGPQDPFSEQWMGAVDNIGLVLKKQSRELAPLGRDDIIRRGKQTPVESRKPAIRGVSLPITLTAQENDHFCAVATGKMMLEYIGSSGFTQSEIAEAFGTSFAGTDNQGMMAGLAALTGGRWSLGEQTNPTFEQASRYLMNFLPGKSGIREHARLLRGWREYIYIDPNNGRPSFTMSFYLVNDPYPTNAGQYVMEAANKPITNFYRNLLTLIPPS